ncbi:MAG: hypothetical protein JSW73_00770 [Candidatus Woesearchaeota archaeon]|nr:MAG: hypothetical protein JSW73_00770 [Candidatus Woesearchaeota archaeon]
MKFAEYISELGNDDFILINMIEAYEIADKNDKFLRLRSKYNSKISDDVSVHLFEFPTEEQTLIDERTIEGILYSKCDLPSIRKAVNIFYIEPKDKFIGINVESKNYKKLLKYAARKVDSIEDTPQLIVKNHRKYSLINKELPPSPGEVAHLAIVAAFMLDKAYKENKCNIIFEGDKQYDYYEF